MIAPPGILTPPDGHEPELADSLQRHSVWPIVVPHISAETDAGAATGAKHSLISVRAAELTDEEYHRLLSACVRCAACRAPISPIRERKKKKTGEAGRVARSSALYVSVSCALSECISCSRGSAASAAVLKLVADVAEFRGELKAPPAPPAKPPAPVPEPIAPRSTLPPRQWGLFSTETRRAR